MRNRDRAAWIEFTYRRLHASSAQARELLPEAIDPAWVSLYLKAWKGVDTNVAEEQTHAHPWVWNNEKGREALRDAAVGLFERRNSPLSDALRLLLQPRGLLGQTPEDPAALGKIRKVLRQRIDRDLEEWRQREMTTLVRLPSRDDIAAERELSATMQFELALLPDDERRAVELRVLGRAGEMPWRDVAHCLGVGQKAAHELYDAGIEKLAKSEVLKDRLGRKASK